MKRTWTMLELHFEIARLRRLLARERKVNRVATQFFGEIARGPDDDPQTFKEWQAEVNRMDIAARLAIAKIAAIRMDERRRKA